MAIRRDEGAEQGPVFLDPLNPFIPPGSGVQQKLVNGFRLHVTQPQSKDENQLDWAERVVRGVLKTAERDISVFASISPIAASKPLRTSSEEIGSTGPAVEG